MTKLFKDDAAPLTDGAGVNDQDTSSDSAFVQLPLTHPVQGDAPNTLQVALRRIAGNALMRRTFALSMLRESDEHGRDGGKQSEAQDPELPPRDGVGADQACAAAGRGCRVNIRARFDAIERIDTRTPAERGVMLASLKWVNSEGRLWPATERWAKLAGLTVRGLQRVRNSLIDRGVLRVVGERSIGGIGATTVYAIPALENPDHRSGLQPRPASPETPTAKHDNPDQRDAQPRPVVGETGMNRETNTSQQPVAVVDLLSVLGIGHLRGHPNATPERLAWIKRDAPRKDNPGAWAATCIREGWAVPIGANQSSRSDLLAQARASFDSLPEPEREELLREASRRRPGLTPGGLRPAAIGIHAERVGIDLSSPLEKRQRDKDS